MSSKSFSKISKHCYSYLGYKNINETRDIDEIIDKCLEEIEQISQFRYTFVEFENRFDFLNKDEYIRLLKDCDSYYFVLTTLGKRIDDRTRYYSKIDITKSLIFDACASAYLEYMADEYEKDNLKSPHTFRFCPGYGKTETKDIREIFKYIKAESLGVRLLDSNLMVPMKTMCGIIGVGKESKKDCGKCVVSEKCDFKKRGTTCYEKN
ncbi:MAG: hypothetical protein K6E20_03025 [Acholeplasmatales bacterium]|nr:hypothetical protein [Acholeplasmatales bacterium]